MEEIINEIIEVYEALWKEAGQQGKAVKLAEAIKRLKIINESLFQKKKKVFHQIVTETGECVDVFTEDKLFGNEFKDMKVGDRIHFTGCTDLIRIE